jgi:AraC family transcriptional regulator, exoenzyme S synthesis regulatory protein ExsA
MLNLYQDIRKNPHFNKFQIGDLLFVEYTCPIAEERVSIWTHTDYLVHVVSGKKTWHTANGSWTAEAGQTLFFRKGAAIVDQFFDEEFCLLLFFIPDQFVRETVKELTESEFSALSPLRIDGPAMRVHHNMALDLYFQSMMAFFSGAEKPSESILKLKLKELIVSILVSRGNPGLSSYFRSLASSGSPRVEEIMAANFRFNLSMEDYAALCHRSLSSFKRDFQKQFNEPPGRWLRRRRLEYAAMLLRTGGMSISQIVFECGFEDMSHFSRAFKDMFGISPTRFRGEKKTGT